MNLTTVDICVRLTALVIVVIVAREFLCWFFKINQILRALDALKDPTKAPAPSRKYLPMTRKLLFTIWQKVRPTSSKQQGIASRTATLTGNARSESQL